MVLCQLQFTASHLSVDCTISGESFVPKHFKTGFIYELIHRAWCVCSDFQLFHQELTIREKLLRCNGYPSSFIKTCINNYLPKLNSQQDHPTELGPERRTVLVRLQFSGLISVKIKDRLHV